VVDHLPQNPKIEGSSPTAASGTGRGIIAKQLALLCHCILDITHSTVVEYLPEYPKRGYIPIVTP
jgi:hypothetical protein